MKLPDGIMKCVSRKSWQLLGKTGQLLLSLLLLTVLLFEVYALTVAYVEGNAALPPTFGNFERVRALLAEGDQREEFAFAVVGDPGAGFETFEQIVSALRNEPLSFIVLLGDCVRKGTPGYHRFLRCELAEETSLPYPTFFVVGNHDVDRDRFPISEFEKDYGPTNFSFEYHGCLFIVLRILNKPYSTDESLTFAESVLSTQRSNCRKVFVFMHIPPSVSRDFRARHFENQKELIALFDRFHVDYVIAGDYHGYARVKIANTVYVVTGGGGGHLEREKFGRFHHAIVFKVGPDWVSERVLLVNRKVNEDVIEEFAVAEVYPWMENHWAAAVILNGGVLGILSWALCGLLGRRRTGRLYSTE